MDSSILYVFLYLLNTHFMIICTNERYNLFMWRKEATERKDITHANSHCDFYTYIYSEDVSTFYLSFGTGIGCNWA